MAASCITVRSLQACCVGSDCKIVKLLIHSPRHGADVNAIHGGRTVMHEAVLSRGYATVAVIDCLVRHGANVNAIRGGSKQNLQ